MNGGDRVKEIGEQARKLKLFDTAKIDLIVSSVLRVVNLIQGVKFGIYGLTKRKT
jgi:hypothetical protein